MIRQAGDRLPRAPRARSAIATSVPRLDVENLTLARDGRELIRDAAFRLCAGEIAVVAGGNGCGKSSLFAAVLGTLSPVRGRIAVDGFPAPRGARGRVAYLPQHDGIDAAFPFSVRDVLASAGRPRTEENEALADVGADALADRRFDRLSGGERRRVLIARTLLLGKPLYLFDEPTAALDAASVPNVYAAIARRVRAHGAAALVVAHDVDEATAVADRVYRIADGALRATSAEAVR